MEQLAGQTATAIKNTSAHLRALRQARLVETRRDGTHIWYRLADDGVAAFLLALEALGRRRYAEVREVAVSYLEHRDTLEPSRGRGTAGAIYGSFDQAPTSPH